MEQYRPVRVAVSLPVEIFTTPFYPPLRMTLQNISSGGIFIRTSLAFSVGEILMCKLRLPNMESPRVFITRVARSVVPGVDALDEQSGLGLQFLHSNEVQRRQLVEYVYSEYRRDTKKAGLRGNLRKKHFPLLAAIRTNAAATRMYRSLASERHRFPLP